MDAIDAQYWLFNSLKRLHDLLDIPYPCATREIRGRAVLALMVIREIIATLPASISNEDTENGEANSPFDEF